MTSISSAFHQWRASRDALRAARQAHRQEQSRAEMAQKWGEPPSTAFFVRKVGEREADFQARIAEDIERARAWTEWAEIPDDGVHTLPFFIVRFPPVAQQEAAQVPAQPLLPAPESVVQRALPAPALRGMLALSGPQQAAADTDRHDDDFSDNGVVVTGPNPPMPTPKPRRGLRAFDLWLRASGAGGDGAGTEINDGAPWHSRTSAAGESDLAQAQRRFAETFSS